MKLSYCIDGGGRYNRRQVKKGSKDNMLRKIYPNTRALAGAVILLFGIGLLAACSSENEPVASAEPDFKRLEQRVRARWDTKIAKDFESTWEFNTPNYRRVFPKELYIGKFSYALDWQLTEVKVVNYDAAAAVASVEARVMSSSIKQTSASARAFGQMPTTIREKWILIDGEWWYLTKVKA